MGITIGSYSPGDGEMVGRIMDENFDIFLGEGIVTEEEARALKSWQTPDGLRHAMMASRMCGKIALVAREAGYPIGIAFAGHPSPNIWGDEVGVEIAGLYVDPGYHGKGTGTALVNHVFDDIRMVAPITVGALVLKGNTRTIKRNQRRGYVLGEEFVLHFSEYGTWKRVPITFYKMTKTLERDR
jgi:GNAT superfamily N-acetyltransferase